VRDQLTVSGVFCTRVQETADVTLKQAEPVDQVVSFNSISDRLL